MYIQYTYIYTYTYMYTYVYVWASQVALVVKNMPANAGDTRDVGSVPELGRFSGGGKGNSSILAWKIQWTEEPGGLQSLVSQSWTWPRRLEYTQHMSVYVGNSDYILKVAQSCPTLRPHGLSSPWDSPGQNTGVGSLSFLQGICPNQGLSPGPPHCRRILYQLSHQGSPINQYVYYIYIKYFFRNRAKPK